MVATKMNMNVNKSISKLALRTSRPVWIAQMLKNLIQFNSIQNPLNKDRLEDLKLLSSLTSILVAKQMLKIRGDMYETGNNQLRICCLHPESYYGTITEYCLS
jgi:hypothetical protein